MGKSSIPIVLSVEERSQLEAVVRTTTSQQRLVQRSRVVLLAAEGKGAEAITGELRVPASWVSRWRQCFARDSWPALQNLPRPGPPARYDERTERRATRVPPKTSANL